MNKKLAILAVACTVLIILGGVNTTVLWGTQYLSTIQDYIYSVAAAADWWNCSWSYCKKITIDYTKVQANQDNFPVLIYRETDPDLRDYAQADGDDIAFVDRYNTTQYKHEIEEYNNSNGELTAWVKISSLSSTEDTILYMYYGNPSCSSQEDITATWDSNFKMVQHLNESTGTLYDSTSNDNDGTNNSATYNTSSKIDGGYDFDGNANITCGNDSSLDITSSITLEGWVKDPPLLELDQRSSNVRIVDKKDEKLPTFPGKRFIIERTIATDVPDDIVFVALFSPGVKLNDMIAEEDSIFAGLYQAGKPQSEQEQNVERLRMGLPDELKDLEAIAYSKTFRIEDKATIQMQFDTEEWHNLFSNDGRISYLVFADDSFDFEGTTHWSSTPVLIDWLNPFSIFEGIIVFLFGGEDDESSSDADAEFEPPHYDVLELPSELEEEIEKGELVRVIIRFKEGDLQESFIEKTSFLETAGFVKTAEIDSEDFVAGFIDSAVFEHIKHSGVVEAVYPDDNFEVLLDESLPLIRFDEAFEDFGVTGQGMKVCIIDTGVDSSLINYSYGYDFVNDDPIPDDEHGHGTKVAAVINAIAPDAELVVAKVIDGSGVGYESDVLEALEWCIAQNPDVISFSIGSSGSCDGFCDANFVANMSNDAVDSGIFVVAAAGNDGISSLKSPACGSNVFSVGATDDNDDIAGFSNVNPTLDMFAPGVDIDTKAGGGSGTSFSAPFVAGAALLVLENEILNPVDLDYRLRSTGVPISYTYNETLSLDIGRLDVYNAIADIEKMEPYNYSGWWQCILGDGEEYLPLATVDLLPNADGTWFNQWDQFGDMTADHWDNVDDPVGEEDEDSTYVYTGVLNEIEDFNHATSDLLTGATITNVRVTARMRYVAGGFPNSGGVNIGLRIGVTRYPGASAILTQTYNDFGWDWANNPADSQAWEKSDIDNLQSSLQANDVTSAVVRCTQIYITVTYEPANNAPEASYVDGATDIYAGKKATTFQTRHEDGDGDADIDDCRILLGSGAAQPQGCYNFGLNWNADTEAFTIASGGDYVSIQGCSVTAEWAGGDRGVILTWEFIPDWDMGWDDDAFDVGAWTDDEQEANSGVQWADTGETYNEEDLEVVSFNVSIDQKYEYGDVEGQINDTDWFRGGHAVTGSGTVEYEGSSQTFDSTYCPNVEVQLFYDTNHDGTPNDLGDTYRDTSIDAGSFTIPAYTPSASPWDLQTNAHFNVSVQNINSTGSDNTSGDIEITSKKDNDNSTITSPSVSESSDYINVSGTTIYYGDDMASAQTFTVQGSSSDGSGSGLWIANFTTTTLGDPANDTSPASWSGAYNDVDSGDTWTGTITVTIYDNVNNTNTTTFTVNRDTTNPDVNITDVPDGATGPTNITGNATDDVWVSDVYLYIKNVTGNTHWTGSAWGANTTLYPGNISEIRSSASSLVDWYYNCTDNGVTWGYNTYEVGAWTRDEVNNTETPIEMDTFTLSSGVTLPTVMTNASTGVEETNATLRGYLSSNGSLDTTCGFRYGTSSGSYTENFTKDIYPSGTEFSNNNDSLTKGQIYFYQAWANNSEGFASGSEMTFLTKPDPPNGLTAQANNSNTIYLTWSTGTGYNTTYIERNASGVSVWAREEGTEIYNGTGTYYEDTDLTGGVTYYYQAWSYANWTYDSTTLYQWSDDNDSANATTNNAPVVSNPNPSNGESGVSISITLINATISDGDGDNVNWTIETSPDIGNSSWTDVGQNNTCNYSKNCSVSGLSNSVTYTWYVNVTDGTEWANVTYTFTTIGANKEVISKGQNAYSLEMNPGGTTLYGYINGNSVSTSIDSNWHYVTITYDNTDLKIYKDGEYINSTSIGGDINTNANNLTLGEYLTGTLDEIRVSNTARDAAWINTTYLNTNSPTTFATFGSQIGILTTWSYRKRIWINASMIDTNLGNFPVLISTTDNDLKNNALSNGYDILFTNSSVSWTSGSHIDKLAHEIERYTNATGELVAWVNVTSLSSSTNTTIYMYYGNSLCTANRQNVTGVWDSNYVMVQHLNETSDPHEDSTSYNNDGNESGGVNQSATDEKIDGADWFDGSNDYINFENDSTLNMSTNDFTLEAWVKTTSNNKFILAKLCSTLIGSTGYSIEVNSNKLMGRLNTATASEGNAVVGPGNTTINDNSWHYLVAVFDKSDKGTLYVDANNDNETDISSVGSVNTDYNLTLAKDSSPGGGNLTGTIDEVRISNIVRNSSWINATYNNVNDSTNFTEFGGQEIQNVAPTQSSPSPSDGATGQSLNPTLSITVGDANIYDLMNVTFHTNATGSWGLINYNDSVYNGTYSQTNSSMDSYNKTYWWSVNVTDNTTWTNQTYSFRTYNLYVCDDSDAQGYYGSDGDGQFNDDDGEFSATNYSQIDEDDNEYVENISDISGEYTYHKFNFTIGEDVASITQINITWKGRGDDTNPGPLYGHSLWVYNYSSSSWSEFDSGTSSSKESLYANKSNDFSHWISGGYLECGAQCDRVGDGMLSATQSRLQSYYVEVKVTSS